MIIASRSFNNTFNIVKENIVNIEIVENNEKTNCYIRKKGSINKFYNKFILVDGDRVKTLCEISFYLSSKSERYIPRLTFKKIDKNFNQKQVESNKDINISFGKSEESEPFWKLIAFLYKFKTLVDIGDFEDSYKVLSKRNYFTEFENKNEKEKVEDIIQLFKSANLSEEKIKEVLHEPRKKNLKAFLYFLKNQSDNLGKSYFELYKEKFHDEIKGSGEESIWHHFLKKNDWILGLNVDIKFIEDFESEIEVGVSDSKGSLNPVTDFLGISNYTTIIELKKPSTLIFKAAKSTKLCASLKLVSIKNRIYCNNLYSIGVLFFKAL